MAKTLIIPASFSLEAAPKDLRHEVNRGDREGLECKKISQEEHERHLRDYRKRKGLLMPPFNSKAWREFHAAYTKEGKYLCSMGLFEHNKCLRIQGVSIDAACPYYGFSWFVFKCLGKARAEGFRGLDLAGGGDWKEKWTSLEEDDGFAVKKSMFGGRVSKLLAKIYWSLKGK